MKIPVCLCDHLTVGDPDFPSQFTSPVCSTCVFLFLTLTACLPLIFHLLLRLSGLNMLWIVQMKKGGKEE